MSSNDKLIQSLKLYLVTDKKCYNGNLLSTVEDAIKGGVTLVQYREKEKSHDKQVEEATALKYLCDTYKIPFIINDNVPLAVAIDATGAHVGQNDLTAGDARALIGDGKWLGVSVSSVEEALLAQNSGADYLGVGAVFGTQSKEDAKAVPHEVVTAICSAVTIPVVAIGGINETNVLALQGRGLAGIAVISAILGSESPETSAKGLSLVKL